MMQKMHLCITQQKYFIYLQHVLFLKEKFCVKSYVKNITFLFLKNALTRYFK